MPSAYFLEIILTFFLRFDFFQFIQRHRKNIYTEEMYIYLSFTNPMSKMPTAARLTQAKAQSLELSA